MNSIIPVPIRTVCELLSLPTPLYKVHYFDEVSCRYVPLNGLFNYAEFLAFQSVYCLPFIRTPFFNKHYSKLV